LVHESPQRGAIAPATFFAVARSRYCVMALSAERRPTIKVGVLVLLTVAVLLVATPYSTRGVLLAEPDDPERQVPLSVSCLSRVRMRDRSRTRALCLSRVSSHLDVPGCARARSRSLASLPRSIAVYLYRASVLSQSFALAPPRAHSLSRSVFFMRARSLCLSLSLCLSGASCLSVSLSLSVCVCLSLSLSRSLSLVLALCLYLSNSPSIALARARSLSLSLSFSLILSLA